MTTPTTSLTIRGTKFILAVAADGSTTIGVLEGAVDVTPCGGGQPVLENEGHQSLLDSHRCEVAVVFCDLRGFTTFSAWPNQMTGWAEYHKTLGEIIVALERL